MPRELYTQGTYLEHHPTWHAEDSAWKVKQIARMMQKHRLKPKTVAEVGCGAGEILLGLKKIFRKTDFTGYEISPQAYKICKRKTTPSLHFVLGDFAETRERVDVLLLIDIIEHVEDVYAFLRSVHPRANQTILHIPLDLSVQSLWRLKPLLNYRRRAGHIHSFTKDTALALLRETGYEIVDYRYTASGVERPSFSFWNLIANIPRRLLFVFAPDLTARILGGYSLLVLAK